MSLPTETITKGPVRPPILKILHYPVVVCPNLVAAMSSSTREGEILTIKQVAEYLKVALC